MLYKGGENVNVRGFFQNIFGKKNVVNVQNLEATKLVDSYTNSFSPYNGLAYDDATVRDCVDTIARHFGKMKLKHVVRVNGKVVREADRGLNYILSTRPNCLMNAAEFLEKVIAQYYCHNNAFIYVERDDLGNVQAVWPLNYQLVELLTDTKTGKQYLRFSFGSGQRAAVSYEDVIHIKRHFNRDEMYGDDNSQILNEDLDTLGAVKNSVINAVKNFTALRGLIMWKSTMRPEDEESNYKKFIERLNIGKGSGIGSIDNKADFKQLTTQVTTFSSAEMKYARDTIYKHFGVSEKIISGDYSEDEYIAFYESVLEPIAIKLSQEFTDKVFTDREKAFGNEIILESNRLNFMSVNSKIKICQSLIPAGGLTVNEIREIFGYAAVEGGDERMVSLNFIKAGDISKYQTGEDSSKGGEKDGKNSEENGEDSE